MERLSLLEILSRSEIPYTICDNCFLSNEGALVAKINDLNFWKTTYIDKDFTELQYA